MTPITVSDNLKGGSGPFEWEIVDAPEGLKIEPDPSNSRIAKISGTPTKEVGAGQILVKVKDTSNDLER